MARTACILCTNEYIYLMKRNAFPITASPSDQPFTTDVFQDQIFYKCSRCASIQLVSLIDPDILYKSAHNNTTSTPTWSAHHTQFSEFIGTPGPVLEIGGQGLLYTLLTKRGWSGHPYACLDICEPTHPVTGIDYKIGNCEEFDFTGHKTLVLSHVFEHLFRPRTFVENIHRTGVESVYISIPNMEGLVDVCPLNILHNEHTYYIDRTLMEWLFHQYGYVLSNYYEFRTHSLFFHFTKSATPLPPTPIPDRSSITDRLYESIVRYSDRIRQTPILPGSFIIPAGLIGQLIVYLNKPEEVTGFLDNDTSKQNIRVYGTPWLVYGFDELLKRSSATIYIMAGPYQKELLQQIESYKKDFKVIVL